MVLGISGPAMKHRMTDMRLRNDGLTNVQLAYLLGLSRRRRRRHREALELEHREPRSERPRGWRANHG